MRDLMRAAGRLTDSAKVQLLQFGELTAAIGLPSASSNQELAPEYLPDLDAVIVRSMPLGSLEQIIFRMDCLQRWEDRGVVVVNPPKSLEVAIDKWLTLHRLDAVGLPVPATMACQSRIDGMEAFERLGGDVVIKPLFGGEGRGLIRVQDKDIAWRVMGALQQIGQVLYIQQFTEHFGYDIRVMVIGDKVFSMKRIATHDSWRTNISQGSRAEPHQISENERELAVRAANAVGGSVLGIDLLPTKDGRLLVLEVNAVPGWKGLSQALNIDIAYEILKHIQGLVRNQ